MSGVNPYYQGFASFNPGGIGGAYSFNPYTFGFGPGLPNYVAPPQSAAPVAANAAIQRQIDPNSVGSGQGSGGHDAEAPNGGIAGVGTTPSSSETNSSTDTDSSPSGFGHIAGSVVGGMLGSTIAGPIGGLAMGKFGGWLADKIGSLVSGTGAPTAAQAQAAAEASVAAGQAQVAHSVAEAQAAADADAANGGNSSAPSGGVGVGAGAGVGAASQGGEDAHGGQGDGPGDGGDGPGGGGDGGGDGGACFTGDTPILMGDWRWKAISEVRCGDFVMAFDGVGPLSPRRVIAKIEHSPSPVMRIEHLRVTPEHPFLRPDGSWTKAGQLQPGDTIVTTGGFDHVIREILPPDEKERTFNFTVKDLHTYIAGGFRVHNKLAMGGVVGRSAGQSADNGRVSGRAYMPVAKGIRAYGLGFADGGVAGLVHHDSPGRADSVAAVVPRGAYIMPADVVSALGQGNTANGDKTLRSWASRFHGASQASGAGVHVRLSGGEFHIPPHVVAALGHGSIDRGAKVLDQHVKRIRAANVKRLRALPPPQ